MGASSQAVQSLWAFRAGQRLGASPRAQIGAQVLGALLGGAVVVPVYILIVNAYGVANATMPAPSAVAFKATAQAVQGGWRRCRSMARRRRDRACRGGGADTPRPYALGPFPALPGRRRYRNARALVAEHDCPSGRAVGGGGPQAAPDSRRADRRCLRGRRHCRRIHHGRRGGRADGRRGSETAPRGEGEHDPRPDPRRYPAAASVR